MADSNGHQSYYKTNKKKKDLLFSVLDNMVHGTISINRFYRKQTDFFISYKDFRTAGDIFIWNIHLCSSDSCVVTFHDD